MKTLVFHFIIFITCCLLITQSQIEDARFCKPTNETIPAQKVCNEVVNCNDGSDEMNCSCRERLDPTRICDGNYDCLDMSDELGCFGCRSNISCYYNQTDVNMNNSSKSCFSKSQRCDQTDDCSNGKDERDCIRILGQNDNVSYLLSVYKV